MMAPREVTFTPDVVNVGTVIVEISNYDDEDHTLEVAGFLSRLLPPNSRAFMKVTFKKPGIYPVSISSDDPVPISGTIKVIG